MQTNAKSRGSAFYLTPTHDGAETHTRECQPYVWLSGFVGFDQQRFHCKQEEVEKLILTARDLLLVGPPGTPGRKDDKLARYDHHDDSDSDSYGSARVSLHSVSNRFLKIVSCTTLDTNFRSHLLFLRFSCIPPGRSL